MVTCRSTPPSQTRATLSLVPRQLPLLPTPATPAPPPSRVWCTPSQPSRLLTEQQLGDPHSCIYLYLPVPQVRELEFSAAHFSQEGSSPRFVCIHHFWPVPWKRTVSFSSLFLLLPRTKRLSHPSVSYLGAEASRYSRRCKEKFPRNTLLQS